MRLEDDQKEQLQIAGHYDTQLWAIPAVFFALAGFTLQIIDKEDFVGWWNTAVFGIAAILSSLLLLLFNKIHCQQLRLNELIKNKNPELASFYSPDSKVFDALRKDHYFPKRYLAKVPVSVVTKYIMSASLVTSGIISISLLIKLVCK